MADVQAPAPPRLAGLAGLVFFRLRPYPTGPGTQRPGQVLARLRVGWEPPPYGAEAWKAAGGRWSTAFGGRRVPVGGALAWEWDR